MKYDYPPLTGKCKICGGCILLENPNFTGVKECKYADDPIKQIKQILGIQEKSKL